MNNSVVNYSLAIHIAEMLSFYNRSELIHVFSLNLNEGSNKISSFAVLYTYMYPPVPKVLQHRHTHYTGDK